MKTRRAMAVLCCSALAALIAQQATADVVLDFSFDNTANVSGPAFQEFDNGVGSPVYSITNGAIDTSSTQAAGFNTVSSVDLSGYSAFTVNMVVDSSNFDSSIATYNGGFMGITTAPGANGTTGGALWQNVGTATKPSIGVQFGDAGRGTTGFVELAVDTGGYTFTQLIAAPTVAANDGFSLSLTFTDNGASDAGVAVTSTGMGTDINYIGTLAGLTYASFADTVYGNVSSQGNADFDMASYSIDAIPEPATLGLIAVFGGGVLFIRRRFMM